MVKVKVYSTMTCPHCYTAKDFLKKNKVKFEEIDVTVDQKKAKEMIEVSGQMGVPVIVIGTEVIVGFDEVRIRKALGLK